MTQNKIPKHIILIKDGELLPIQKNSPCLRMGSLARVLVKRGYKVTWLATTWSHQFKHKINSEGLYKISNLYQIALLDCGSYKKNISISRIHHHKVFALKTTKWLEEQKNQPDLVLSAYPIPGVAVNAAHFCLNNRIPFILDIRDLWPDIFVDKLGKVGKIFLYPLLKKQTKDLFSSLKIASDVIAVSKKYLEWGKQNTPKEYYEKTRYHHFPIGAEKIDRKNEVKKASEILNLKNLKEKCVFTFLGSFGKSYDLNLIVEAAQYYYKQGNLDIHFCIAGDGEQRPLIEEYTKLLPNLSYFGWLDVSHTRILLSCSDVGIMPLQSVSGTFPNKPFQYMAASLPIISSLEGEFSEFLVKHNLGLNFEQGKLPSFLKAINILINRHKREKMQECVADLFDSKFEQQIIYNNYADIIAKAILQ